MNSRASIQFPLCLHLTDNWEATAAAILRDRVSFRPEVSDQPIGIPGLEKSGPCIGDQASIDERRFSFTGSTCHHQEFILFQQCGYLIHLKVPTFEIKAFFLGGNDRRRYRDIWYGGHSFIHFHLYK